MNRRWTWLLCFTATACGLIVVAACQKSSERDAAKDKPNEPEWAPTRPFFQDVTEGSGVNITYHNGEESGHYAILESLGGGLALVDFDGDGLLDLVIAGGGYFDGPDKKLIKGHPCKLYRNKGNFQFEDVSDRIKLDGPWFYSHGVAVADYDRDGWPDVLITGWGRMALLHNEPVDPKDPAKGRKLVDVTKKVGLPEGLWTTSAAWGDLDGDGYPDLYVCQYVDWNWQNHPTDCHYDGHTRDVCPPKKFTGLPHKLFRNPGAARWKGTSDQGFTDVSKEAGIRGPRSKEDYKLLAGLDEEAIKCLQAGDTESANGDTKSVARYGKGLGVIIFDANGDGKLDIYVANDTVDKFLYLNRRAGPGKFLFEEKGQATGTARDNNGAPQGSMGLAVGDPEGVGKPWIWVTNYEHELHSLYKNDCEDGREFFLFHTTHAGLAALGQDTVGWGTGFIDLDHHGWEDLFFTTGHAIRHPTGAPRAQRPGLFRNKGTGKDVKFYDIRAHGGPYFQKVHVGRGAVLGDLDNDGRVDIVISHLNEPVAVLRNDADTTGNHWLGIELEGKDHADVVGARVVLESGGRKQTRFEVGGGSYASSPDRRHVFGLGTDKGEGLEVTVYWPSGKDQKFKFKAIDRYWKLVEGEAEPRARTGERPSR
jgi:hypothetical protein